MNRFMVLLALPILGGCNVHSNKPSNGSENVSIQADENGEVAFNLPFVKGSVNIPKSTMHSGNVDLDGVKLPPGSSMTGFNMKGGGHGALVTMSFTAPASADQVRSYFLDRFKRKGMEVALAGDAVTGKTRDGSPFTIHIGSAPNGSLGRIQIEARN